MVRSLVISFWVLLHWVFHHKHTFSFIPSADQPQGQGHIWQAELSDIQGRELQSLEGIYQVSEDGAMHPLLGWAQLLIFFNLILDSVFHLLVFIKKWPPQKTMCADVVCLCPSQWKITWVTFESTKKIKNGRGKHVVMSVLKFITELQYNFSTETHSKCL